jgi:hypothetical protein
VKPTDVLVHPRTPTVTERDTDTQPVRTFPAESAPRASRAAAVSQEPPASGHESPDPRHGPEVADDIERNPDRALEDTAPHPVFDDAPHDDAPSGRLRSTPLPPED